MAARRRRLVAWRALRRRRPAALGAAIAIAALAPGSAAADRPGDGSERVTSVELTQSPAQVEAYWTRARMRSAEPAGPRLGSSGRVAPPPVAARIDPAPDAPTAGRPLNGRSRASDASASSAGYPERVHGKVFFTISGGSDPGNFVCSGTVVGSPSHALVWTAGHCVNDAEFGGGYASNWSFVPGYRDGQRPYGTWVARELATTRGWAEDQNLRLDLGAAVLGRDAQGRGVQDVVGSRGIAFDKDREQQFEVFGYPVPSLLRPDFTGGRLYRCDSPLIGADYPPGSGPATLEIDCDMAGGASGGGWVIDGGRVNSVTSYTYSGDVDSLFGPYHGEVAEQLYRETEGEPLRCAKREVTNLGGPGEDRFSGGDGEETFKLAGGADAAAAGPGIDAACGGGGRDRLDGGEGRDRLRGGGGRDELIGGPGRDVCVGGRGRDTARGCEVRRRIP